MAAPSGRLRPRTTWAIPWVISRTAPPATSPASHAASVRANRPSYDRATRALASAGDFPHRACNHRDVDTCRPPDRASETCTALVATAATAPSRS